MPTASLAYTYTAPAAVVDAQTEMALKAEQNAQHDPPGKRPTMAEVVAGILTKWAKERQKPA